MLINHYILGPFPPDKHTSDRSALLFHTHKKQRLLLLRSCLLPEKAKAIGASSEHGPQPVSNDQVMHKKIGLPRAFWKSMSNMDVKNHIDGTGVSAICI